MPERMRPGKDANFIFNRVVNLHELKDVDLNGAHIHFNGPFDMRDLLTVDLRNTTIVINDYGGVPPCSNCGKSLVTNETQHRSKEFLAASVTEASTSRTAEITPRPTKRPRSSEPSEDGEVQPSSPVAQTLKPSAYEIHPERMRMLKDPSPETTPPPVKVISRTKSNCLDMPFNRLEDRILHQSARDLGEGRRLEPIVAAKQRMSTNDVGAGSDMILRNRHLNGRQDKDLVDNFLQQLEPVLVSLPQQSESYGRLSPPSCSDLEEFRDASTTVDLRTYNKPRSSEHRQSKLETSAIRQHIDADASCRIKIEGST